jgi:hypothetical protein
MNALISSDTIPFELTEALINQIGFQAVTFQGFNDESEYVFSAINEEGEWAVQIDYDPVYDCADVRYQSILNGRNVQHETDMFL